VYPFMLLVGQQERHQACKSSATTIPKSLLLGISLTWSNSEKKGQLDQKPNVVVVAVVCLDSIEHIYGQPK